MTASLFNSAQQAERFDALDDDARAAFLRASRALVDVQSGRTAKAYDDELSRYAAKCGRLIGALGELLDLVGLAPEG